MIWDNITSYPRIPQNTNGAMQRLPHHGMYRWRTSRGPRSLNGAGGIFRGLDDVYVADTCVQEYGYIYIHIYIYMCVLCVSACKRIDIWMISEIVIYTYCTKIRMSENHFHIEFAVLSCPQEDTLWGLFCASLDISISGFKIAGDDSDSWAIISNIWKI